MGIYEQQTSVCICVAQEQKAENTKFDKFLYSFKVMTVNDEICNTCNLYNITNLLRILPGENLQSKQIIPNL